MVDSLPITSKWKCEVIKVEGNIIGEGGKPKTENVELWFRNPIECIQDLIGNPSFQDHIAYAPQRVFTSDAGTTRIYDEAWTGNWWWAMQVSARLS